MHGDSFVASILDARLITWTWCSKSLALAKCAEFCSAQSVLSSYLAEIASRRRWVCLGRPFRRKRSH